MDEVNWVPRAQSGFPRTQLLIFCEPTKPDPLLCPPLCQKPCMMTARNVKSLRRSPSRKPFRAGKLRLRRCWETLEVLQLPAGLVPLLTHVSEETDDNESNNTDPAPEGPQGTSHPGEHVNTRPPHTHTTTRCPTQGMGPARNGLLTPAVTVCWPCVGTGNTFANRQTNPLTLGAFTVVGDGGRRSEINSYIGEGRGGRWIVSVCERGERGWWNFEPHPGGDV